MIFIVVRVENYFFIRFKIFVVIFRRAFRGGRSSLRCFRGRIWVLGRVGFFRGGIWRNFFSGCFLDLV